MLVASFSGPLALSVLMIAVVVVLFCVSSGIEIDLARKRVRVYKAIGKTYVGAWLSVQPYNTISIRYTNESQLMGGRGPELTVRVRTFDLHFTGPDGASRSFHDFTNYAKARKCADTMANQWSWSLIDEIQERRHYAQANAPNRKR